MPNERKSVVAERFIRTFKISEYMTSISKNMYIDQLDEILTLIKKILKKILYLKLAIM